jgi:hypothetical protein
MLTLLPDKGRYLSGVSDSTKEEGHESKSNQAVHSNDGGLAQVDVSFSSGVCFPLCSSLSFLPFS